ncbi:MAG: Ig-like domain-containing protein, partial [Gemmatimonadetes bacterium]|nr:Ig-like domain-containing protein [Gemmatimonadota bacterium]
MRIRTLSILLLGAALAGCKDSSGSGPHPAVITASTPGDLSAAVGNPLPLSVKVTGASGEAVPGVTVLWTVSSGGGSVNPASSVTDATGVATTTWTLGPTSGSQTAMARFDASHFATFTATATPGPAQAVHVTPDSTALASFGDTTRLTATAADAAHNPVPVTWLSLDPSIATVNASGRVTAASNGRARIVASASGLADTAIVRVQQVVASLSATPSPLTAEVGVNTPLAVTAKDARGNVIATPTLSFASTNTPVATVSSAGVVTAQATGTASIVITGGTAADTVPVMVTATGRYTSVAALANASCGTTAGGTLRCW